jgi:hypothetical protein
MTVSCYIRKSFGSFGPFESFGSIRPFAQPGRMDYANASNVPNESNDPIDMSAATGW